MACSTENHHRSAYTMYYKKLWVPSTPIWRDNLWVHAQLLDSDTRLFLQHSCTFKQVSCHRAKRLKPEPNTKHLKHPSLSSCSFQVHWRRSDFSCLRERKPTLSGLGTVKKKSSVSKMCTEQKCEPQIAI